ncbi:HAD family hydrolase [Streptomyces sp. TRM49041]|uniref:HAD family hydrolase n=1 Tax=Streptomyces sp. TRM49041 TaxID=2603216 RepID=UPI0011ED72C4|nr:HAD family hydrolase [Streptomyces sp. TRM49041]
MSRTRIAFFDVDGTLTTATTIFRFLRHFLSATGHPPHVYEQRRQRLKAMTDMGLPREETNRAYFDSYRGADVAEVERLAREWFDAELRAGGLFHPYALAALREHRADGDLVMLVSGSFPACLAPVAAHCGADETWCTLPEIVDGVYTGGLTRTPMIGKAKADALLAAASAHRVPPEHCVAYGDHVSDLPMLQAAGTAVVVGGDDHLRAVARLRSWRLLPGAPSARQLPLPSSSASPSSSTPSTPSPSL